MRSQQTSLQKNLIPYAESLQVTNKEKAKFVFPPIIMGVPNYRTNWTINYARVSGFIWNGNNTTVAKAKFQWKFKLRLLENNVVISEQNSETFTVEPAEEVTEKPIPTIFNFEFPQTPLIPGGNVLQLEIILEKDSEQAEPVPHAKAFLLGGIFSMGYTLNISDGRALAAR